MKQTLPNKVEIVLSLSKKITELNKNKSNYAELRKTLTLISGSERYRIMNETKNIQPYLQEVETAYQSLAMENVTLKEKIVDQKNELQLIIANLEKELQTVKDGREQISHALQYTQAQLDRFHPDMQTLRDQLEQTEVETNTLSMEVAQKNNEIQQLEDRIQELTKSK